MAPPARDTTDALTPGAAVPGAARTARAGYERLFREGHRFGFFQAVRLLEQRFAEAPAPGTTSAYRAERIRFRPDAALAFPATDVRRIEHVDAPLSQVCVTATFMGLYGIDSPLPYYLYDGLATEEEDTFALRDFLDLFNHRFYAFFYRAWKKYRPALHGCGPGQDTQGRGAHAKRFLALAGLGTPGALDAAEEAAGKPAERAPAAPMRLAAFAGRLMGRRRNAEGLRALLTGFLEGVPVEITENVPRWVPIRGRPAMGDGFALGGRATVGEGVYDRASRFRICIGPVGQETYRALLPGGPKAEAVRWLVRSYAPDHLDFEVALRLSAEDAPPARLGQREAQLGLTTFLGRPPARAEVTRVVRYC